MNHIDYNKYQIQLESGTENKKAATEGGRRGAKEKTAAAEASAEIIPL